MKEAFVTSVRWIPCGRALENPMKAIFSKRDMKELLKEMKEMEGNMSDGDLEDHDTIGTGTSDLEDHDTIGTGTSDKGQDHDKVHSDVPLEFNMEIYDDDKNEKRNLERIAKGDFPGRQFFSTLDTDLPNALDDPFLKDDMDEDSEDEGEEEANHIRETDCPLLVCSADPDLPALEMYIYHHESGAFFIHHDISLGAVPLCVEWLDHIGTSGTSCGDGKVNLAAVGSYGHGMIEIWDLDIMDGMEPVLTLGQMQSSGRKKNKNKSVEIEGHTAPVLALHKNPLRTSVLASASADETVKIWDLLSHKCVETLNHHTSKVQTIKWHPIEEPILLTAAYDKTVAVVDTRAPKKLLKSSLHSDVESCCWDRHHPTHCWVSSEDGRISVYDLRTLSNDVERSNTLYHLKVHDSACTGVSDCPIPGLMITCSLSGYSTIWNSNDLGLGSPSKIFERNLKAGPLFSVDSNPDVSTVFSFGGSVVVIWDVGDSNPVNIAFKMPLINSIDHRSSEIPKTSKSNKSRKRLE